MVRASASTTSAAAEEEDAEAGEDELVLRQLTLDEWKASQSGVKQPMSKLNIRKPGEGCASDPRWKKMEVLRRKRDEEEEGRQMDHSGQFDDAVSCLSCNSSDIKHVLLSMFFVVLKHLLFVVFFVFFCLQLLLSFNVCFDCLTVYE